MSKRKKKDPYVKKPEMTAAQRRRFEIVKQVLANELTMAEAAAQLGLSRVRTQTIVHRAEQALLEASQPGQPGRPPSPPSTSKNEARLERENQKLREDMAKMRQALEMAAELLKDRIRVSNTARSPRTTTTSGTRTSRDDDDPEGAARVLLAQVHAMTAAGITLAIAATIAGRSPATLSRWRQRERDGKPLRERPGPGSRSLDTEAAHRAACVVRQLNGLVGAASLAQAVEGISRRQAARVKQAEVTAMERERKQEAVKVIVTRPGIVRGFDAMDVSCGGDDCLWLVAGDASVPYRTSITTTATYQARAVHDALAADVAENGAPLVYRFDRHRSHYAAEVRALLEENGILPLSGPPNYPPYYGQLERQNREHRDWLARADIAGSADLVSAAEAMRVALNEVWCRPTLRWLSAADVWRTRQPVTDEDRDRFRGEVYDRNARLVAKLDGDEDLAWRLAVEHTLIKQGYLRLERRDGAK